MRARRWVSEGMWVLAAFGLLGSSFAIVQHLGSSPADAGVHEETSTTRYREVWIDHDEFRGIKDPDRGCGYDNRRWFVEPTPSCGDYPLDFELDSVAGVTRAEVFFDLWRARRPRTVDFRVNASRTFEVNAGANWSRTPAVETIPVGELRAGTNELILEEAPAYHLHDAAIRLHDLPGAYPTGRGITSVSPAPSGGVLTVGRDETVTISAEVIGADAVEFIAYYDGFDRDNDGQRVDWQSFTRNNWHPGRTDKNGGPPVDDYGTIGHVGTVHSNGTVVIGGSRIDNSLGGTSGNTYTIEFDTSLVPNDSPIRFKVRALKEASNDGFWVVDALGGATTSATLARSSGEFVEYVVDPNFQDAVLNHGDTSPRYTDAISREFVFDTSDLISVTMIGNYWEQPDIFINPSGPVTDDSCGSGGYAGRVRDDWLTDNRDVTGFVRQGTNVVCYEHVGGFGEFVEKPGPMFVMRRTTGSAGNVAPVVEAGGPYEGLVGGDVELEGSATDRDPLTIRWSDISGPGTVSFDDRSSTTTTATFSEPGSYTIELRADDGELASSDRTTIVVDGPPEVEAGGPYTIAEAGTLTLAGSVADQGGATSTWARVTGPGTVTFTDEEDPSTAATFSAPGEYVLALTADDGTFPAVEDQATVTVDAAPRVDAGGDTFVVLPASLPVDGSVVDDGPVSVEWSSDGPAAVQFADPNASATTAAFDGPGTYILTVVADDGRNPTVADSVTVEVFDAPPPDLPPTVDAGGDVVVVRPAAAELNGSVIDDGAVTTSWTQVSGPGTTTFDDASAASTTATFSGSGSYVLRLTADDGANGPVTDDVTVTVTGSDEPTDPPPPVGSGGVGYWMGDGSGEIHGFGDASGTDLVGAPIVALAATPDGAGPWVLTVDGIVHARNGVAHFGDVELTGLGPGELPASISVLPDGSGYWVFTDRGRVLDFGAAPELEDLVDLGISDTLNGPIVDSAATPDGAGAYLVAADGGVFAIGTATFRGSMGGQVLNAQVTGVAVDPDGEGYWLVAADGGIFAFDAVFLGSMGGRVLNAPVVGAVAFGDGYLMVGADGGIFNFSDQEFLGSLGANPPGVAVTAVAGFPS